MYIPIGVKTDHSLLKSMIKIDNLIKFLKDNNLTSCGICDDNLFGTMEFYHKCLQNNIKPIIGLTIKIKEKTLYLYAQNYPGYQNLLSLNTLMQQRELTIKDLEILSRNLICIIPFASSDIYNILVKIYPLTYIGYVKEYEKNNALILTSNIVFFNEIKALDIKDVGYLKYLDMINEGLTINNYENQDYSYNYYLHDYTQEDEQTIKNLIDLIDIKIPYGNLYIPKYKNMNDSYAYLDNLTHKGLLRRLKNREDPRYTKRLEYELSVIKSMGFVDYFLIVYDYILYAKKSNILVGPGRGSAAGSLVAYCLGITDIDPIKYDLLFERFLNKERITMPDIDVDFEDLRRGEIIEYLKETYGKENVANIMTYSSLTSKQVIRDVAKVCSFPENKLNSLSKLIDAKSLLKDNYQNNANLKKLLKEDKETQNIYKIALKLEGLKRQISTHAAGVVISSEKLDKLIPIVYNEENIMTGCTMEYLEELGLIKMDILSIRNLRTIHDILDLIEKESNRKIRLNNIPLNDEATFKLFQKGNTEGVFQFESEGMKSFLTKLKPTCFDDLIAAIALFRPGPMENISEFISRKEGKIPVKYLHSDLEPILNNTYGIIVYQEQIMQILSKMGGYSYQEADNIRRAMSKKKHDVMEKERNVFITKATSLGYEEQLAQKVYDLISKFANYGFNKSHSVAYALVGYQMAFLKVHFPHIYYANMLNNVIGSETKTNEYLQIVKQNNLKVLGPNINKSTDIYQINLHTIQVPLGIIKNVGVFTIEEILNERKKGLFQDFPDFVKRTYGKSVTKKVIESLIYAGAFSDFIENKHTLINNIDTVITYAELASEIDSPLVLTPALEEAEEFPLSQLVSKEKEVLGFYITNHPASRFHMENIVKLENIANYFDKFIRCVVLVTKINSTNTKKGEKMYFITAEDETSSNDFIIFPNKSSLITKFQKDDLILVTGKVERRMNIYQIVVSNIEKIT